MIKRALFFTIMLLFSGNAWSGWSGSGKITELYVYPEDVIVVHGTVGTGSNTNCNDNDRWSFSWSQFSPEQGRRIMAMLLSAKISKSVFQVVFDGVCGPENHKRFNGQVKFE